MIYECLKGLSNNKNNSDVLNIIPMDREMTIKVFNEFENKQEDKTMY